MYPGVKTRIDRNGGNGDEVYAAYLRACKLANDPSPKTYEDFLREAKYYCDNSFEQVHVGTLIRKAYRQKMSLVMRTK